MYNIAAIFIGGGFGSLARYGISEFVKQQFNTTFPIATLLSNFLSCALLALTVALLSDKISLQPTLRLLVIVGFCGGFSTFSSFSFETVELIKCGNYYYVLANIFISVIACFGVIYFILKNQ
ncbi:MAG: fluoride efflux transporter CrcB [Bacteroidetes bacterium]|nr:fluoride efflux transporter CrcB [Bacteroidota bacterium]